MPTAQSYLVAPSGGDYTNLTDALAALPTNFVTADEVWTINIETFSGGLSEAVDTPTLTTDATRFLTIKAASGHEYDPVADTGAFIVTSTNYNACLDVYADYTLVQNLGFKNNGYNNSRAVFTNSAFVTVESCYGYSASTNTGVFNCPAATDLTIKDSLAEGGKYSFSVNNYADATFTNNTAIDPATAGYRHGSTSASIVTNNCLHIDGAGGGGTFSEGASVTGDYNATSDTTSPTGANSLANRTTSDLVDYASGDYRTASGSALATAGNGTDAAYIGYALESSGGLTITPTGIASAEAFGTASVERMLQEIDATGIATAEAFGTHEISTGLVVLTPIGITTEESFGSPEVENMLQLVTPTGIVSAEEFGAAVVKRMLEILTAVGIGSSEAFGTATVTGGDSIVIPIANRQTWQSIANYLKTLGFTGSNNEIITDWLNSEGYTGGFNVAFYDYWEVTEGLEGSFTDKFGVWRQQ